MNAIRQAATSGLASAAVGGVAGGVGAHYSGGDVSSGMGYGAMLGAGAKTAMPGISKLAGSARLGIQKTMPKMMSNLGMAGMKPATKAMSAMYNPLKSAYKGAKNFGPVKSGIAGGIGGAAYATLSSNGGGSRYSQASLNERLNYHRSMKEMQMSYNLKESMMKKQIWQAKR